MKRLLPAILLAISVSAFLTGCSSSGEAPPPTDNNTTNANAPGTDDINSKEATE
jgi:outer membrane biogenesis lipoprotein LolB